MKGQNCTSVRFKEKMDCTLYAGTVRHWRNLPGDWALIRACVWMYSLYSLYSLVYVRAPDRRHAAAALKRGNCTSALGVLHPGIDLENVRGRSWRKFKLSELTKQFIIDQSSFQVHNPWNLQF
jgi:hypothetical protein